MKIRDNIKSDYKRFKRGSSLLAKVARQHNVSKAHVCNVIAGRKKNEEILRSVKRLIIKSNVA